MALSVSPAGESQGADLCSSELIKSVKKQYFKNDSGSVEEHPPSMEEIHQLS